LSNQKGKRSLPARGERSIRALRREISPDEEGDFTPAARESSVRKKKTFFCNKRGGK